MKTNVKRYIPGKLYRIKQEACFLLKQEAPSARDRIELFLMLRVNQVAPTYSDCRVVDNMGEVYELFLWYDDWEELDGG